MSEALAIQIMEGLARKDADFLTSIATKSAVVSGGIFPASLPLGDAMNVMKALWAALPDFHIEVTAVENRADAVAVTFMWGGTQTGSLAVPGANPLIPPSGKPVWVADVFVMRFVDDKLVALRINSPDDGGIPAMLAQIGAVAA